MDDDFSNRSHLLAGELAKAAGVSTDTLRHYERKGVLKRPARARNGYRLYPASALDRVLLVRRALSFGFTLDELARILSERDKGGAPCRKVRRLVAEKLLNVEEQIGALTHLRGELSLTLTDWDDRLAGARPETQAHLLETLAASSSSSAKADQSALQRPRKRNLSIETNKKEDKKNE